MAAARRSTGSGTVVALVIFIVLTFVSLGASIWLYQQFSTMQQAVLANQERFDGTIGQSFKENRDWKLTISTSPEFGLKYGKEAYEEVEEQLGKASRYDELRPILGWESISADSVKARMAELGEAIKEDVVESYTTLKELLEHYETQYKEKNIRITQLETELADKTQELGSEREKFEKALADQLVAYNKRNTDHTASDATSTTRYKDFKKMYETARDGTKKTEQELKDLEKLRVAEVEKMTERQEELKDVIEKLRPPDIAVQIMKPEGKVLRIDTSYKFVELAGGEDMEREQNDRFVVYFEAVSGDRTKKGELVISRVHPITSLAMIVSMDEEMLAQDLYVSKQEWEKFEGPRLEEVEADIEKEKAEAEPKEEEKKEEVPPEDVGWGED